MANYGVSVVSLESHLRSDAVIAVSYVISWWTGPRNDGTQLYYLIARVDEFNAQQQYSASVNKWLFY